MSSPREHTDKNCVPPPPSSSPHPPQTICLSLLSIPLFPHHSFLCLHLFLLSPPPSFPLPPVPTSLCLYKTAQCEDGATETQWSGQHLGGPRKGKSAFGCNFLKWQESIFLHRQVITWLLLYKKSVFNQLYNLPCTKWHAPSLETL